MKRPNVNHEAYNLPNGEFNELKWSDNRNKYIDYIEKQLQEQCIINLSLSEQADESEANNKYLHQALKDRRQICDKLESQRKERDELLQRIFNYHISHGFGDDGSFESFADEITELI